MANRGIGLGIERSPGKPRRIYAILSGGDYSRLPMDQPTSAAAQPVAPRLVALDGLRGIAAIVVLMFHFEQFHGTRGAFASGYLAVDFFFLLSGFVLVGPIERRGGLPADGLRIFAARFLRFWPLVALGSALGAGVELFSWPPEQVLPLLALAWLSIPLAWQAGDAFALNGPQWSLFVELAWNALHIVLLRKLSTPLLLAVSCAFGCGLWFGAAYLTTEAIGREYDEVIIGLVRAGFAYPLGIVLGRKQQALRAIPQVAPWAAPALLVAAIVVPTIVGMSELAADFFARAAFVVVLILGIRSQPSEQAARTLSWLGGISFPLYAIHAPIIALAAMIGEAAPAGLQSLVFLCGPALAVGLAHLLAQSWLARGIRLPTANRAGGRQSIPVAQGS